MAKNQDDRQSSRSSKSEDRELSLLERLRQYWVTVARPSWSTFTNALPLFTFWLAIPVLLFLAGSIYQISEMAGERQDFPNKFATVNYESPQEGKFVLFIHYPEKLRRHSNATPDGALAVWLERMEQIATPTPVGNITVTQTSTSSLPLASITHTPMITSSQPTVIPTLTLTPTPLALSLDVQEDSLVFTDAERRPVSRKIILTPAAYGVTPHIIYPRLNEYSSHKNVKIGFQLEDLPTPTGGSAEILIPIESAMATKARNFLSLVFGPSALIGALLAAVAGFAVQQWKTRTEEEASRTRQQEEEEAKKEETDYQELSRLFETEKISDAARQYMEFQRSYSGKVPDKIQRLWKDKCSRFKHLPTLVELSLQDHPTQDPWPVPANMKTEDIRKALIWAKENLDNDWQNFILQAHKGYEPFFRYTAPTQEDVLSSPFKALLKSWTRINLWHEPPLSNQLAHEAEVIRLGLEHNPFHGEHAEDDVTLVMRTKGPMQTTQDAFKRGESYEAQGEYDLAGWIKLPCYAPLASSRPAFVFGRPGSGKTATALYLMYEAIYRKYFPGGKPDDSQKEQPLPRFPVYCSCDLSVDIHQIVRSIVFTLAHYLASDPASYVNQNSAGRATIASLLGSYVGKDKSLRLWLLQAGLPESEYGRQMRKELEEYTQGTPFPSPPPAEEIYLLLRQAFPHGFSGITVLMDLNQEARSPNMCTSALDAFYQLVEKLCRVNVFVKAFIGHDFLPVIRASLLSHQIDYTELKWREEDLSRLLSKRLGRLDLPNLKFLCQPEIKGIDPDDRLVRAAEGLPGHLLRLGNELFIQYKKKGRLLSDYDLRRVLKLPRKGAK